MSVANACLEAGVSLPAVVPVVAWLPFKTSTPPTVILDTLLLPLALLIINEPTACTVPVTPFPVTDVGVTRMVPPAPVTGTIVTSSPCAVAI